MQRPGEDLLLRLLFLYHFLFANLFKVEIIAAHDSSNA